MWDKKVGVAADEYYPMSVIIKLLRYEVTSENGRTEESYKGDT